MDNHEQILQLVKEADPANPLQYVHDIVREYSREKLDSYILNCNDCSEICEVGRTLTLGNCNASVMIIGESMSEEQWMRNHSIPYENVIGISHPFEEDNPGEILHTVLDMLHVDESDLFFINTVNCWPHKLVGEEIVSRTPYKKEVENCSTFINYAIDLVKPLVIITLGGIALNLFKKDSISNARGKWFDIKGIPAIATYHPGYFTKIEGKKDPDTVDMQKWDFVNDMKKAFMYIQEHYPENNVLKEPLIND